MKSSVPVARAARVSIGLSALFLFVYGGCNWITAHRTGVGVFYFQWERAIPFIPLLIPAYMSIDLFFIAAPFLCSTGEELRVFRRRIATAILAAGVCFLMWPFRFAFERPSVEGVLGTVFNWFRRIDAPYNLVPSLHAALLLLVADVYVRGLSGGLRIAAICWFVLIGISPVLTYQHHVIDIAAGAVLAMSCFYFFPKSRVASPVTPNRRIGLYYAAGAVAFGAVAVSFKGWWMLLCWPGVALAIVTSAYFGVGPGVFRKTAGQLPWSTRLVLAPYLLGQYLSLLYYRRRSAAWDVVTPTVWIGSKLTSEQAQEVTRRGVRAVLDLTAEFSEQGALRKTIYCNIPVLDLTAPTQDQLSQMASFIAGHVSQGVVYVHCKIGYSRAAAAVAAYLLVTGRAKNVVEALAIIKRARPSIIIRPEISHALRLFQLNHQRSLVSEPTFLLASADRAFA